MSLQLTSLNFPKKKTHLTGFIQSVICKNAGCDLDESLKFPHLSKNRWLNNLEKKTHLPTLKFSQCSLPTSTLKPSKDKYITICQWSHKSLMFHIEMVASQNKLKLRIMKPLTNHCMSCCHAIHNIFFPYCIH